jgi:hypothetical protein
LKKMIREITRKQIEMKTAQGERIVLVEAVPVDIYDLQHIAGSIQMTAANVRRVAEDYLPNHGSEIVVFGQNIHSVEPQEVARQLMLLGYSNLFLFAGGRQRWIEEDGFQASTHYPPESGTHVTFDETPRYDELPSSATSNQPQVPGLRIRKGGVRHSVAGTGPYQPGKSPQMASQESGAFATDWGSQIAKGVVLLGVFALARRLGKMRTVSISKRLMREGSEQFPVSEMKSDPQREAMAVAHQHRVVHLKNEDLGLERDALGFNQASGAE